MATEAEIAWAAGLFEGEGHIGWSNASRDLTGTHQRPHARLTLSMSDQDVVEKFCLVVGRGKVSPKVHHRTWKPHFKDQWSWEVRSWEDVTAVLSLLLPCLGARRTERAYEVLETGGRARELTCSHCGEPFASDRGDTRYCSKRCKNRVRAAREGHPPLWRERTCSFCKQSYTGGGQHSVGYCSKRCRYYARRQREGFTVPEGVI